MEKNRSLLWSMLISFLCALVISLSGIIYTGQSNADNNRQWCELLTTLDTAYSSTPPQSELGLKVARSIHQLKENFGC